MPLGLVHIGIKYLDLSNQSTGTKSRFAGTKSRITGVYLSVTLFLGGSSLRSTELLDLAVSKYIA